MSYLIVDALRLADLQRMDTCTPTVAEAKLEAEAMAKRYGTAVTVLAAVAVCEGSVEPQWTRDFPVSGWGGAAP